jgi:hypothetical protein
MRQFHGPLGSSRAIKGLVHGRLDGRPWNWSSLGAIDDASMVLDLAYDDVTAWGFAHSRADATTCATWFDSAGVMQTAAANVLRRTHDPATLAPLGYLAEEGSANLLLRSASVGGTSWTNPSSTATLNAATAPDGTTTASKIIANNGTATTGANDNGGTIQVATVSVSAAWTRSFYAKAAEVGFVRLRESAATGTVVKVSLTDGSVVYESGSAAGMAVSARSAGSGWWRVICTRTTGAAETSCNVSIKPGIDTGDGVSGILVWGAQLEQKAFATSYIATVASTVTRAADSLVNTGLATAGWYAQSQGSWIVEYIRPGGTASAALFEVSDNSANNRLFLFESANVPTIGGIKAAAGLTNVAAPGGAAELGSVHRVAIAWDAAGMAIARDGGSVGAGVTFPAQSGSTHLHIGRVYSGASLFSGTIRRIRYYKTRLSNARLQALTA